jgi:hypothetical protein
MVSVFVYVLHVVAWLFCLLFAYYKYDWSKYAALWVYVKIVGVCVWWGGVGTANVKRGHYASRVRQNFE